MYKIHNRPVDPETFSKMEAIVGGSGRNSPVPQDCCNPTPETLRYSSLATLTLQGALSVLSMRHSRSRPGKMFATSAFVLSTEVLKLLFSLILVFKDEPDLKLWMNSLKVHIWESKMNTLKVGIPALVFYIQNNLLYVAATNLDAATFHVTQQAKIFTTALFSVILLKRHLSLYQWLALFILVIGILLVQCSSGHTHRSVNWAENRLLGMGATLGAAFCSGFAGVFFEKILKGSNVSVWMRNVQLAMASIAVGVFDCVVVNASAIEQNGGFFVGYDAFNLYLLVLQASGGMLVAVVVKYADNLLKGFAVCLGIILSSLVSVALFNYKLTLAFAVGVVLVFISILLYGYPQPQTTSTSSSSKPIPK